MISKPALPLFLMLAACFGAGPTPPTTQTTDAPELPVKVRMDDPSIRYVGRFDLTDPARPRCSWSGCTVIFRFKGTGANVEIEGGNNDRIQVVVDGKPTKVIALRGKLRRYEIARGLADGEHTVELVRATEPLFGITRFRSLELTEGGALSSPPPAPDRRIEIIGDSISCGFGNTAKNEKEAFHPDTENWYESYGSMVGRKLGAEVMCTAWSGKLMWPKNTMPEIYDKVLPSDPGSKTWDFSAWQPQAVVIVLGTNDFAGKNQPEKEWSAGYKAFLNRVRGVYPEAMIYVASSPMMSDEWPAGHKARTTIHGYLANIVRDQNESGDKKVKYLEFAQQLPANGFGAGWHPSVATHRVMAKALADALQTDLNWQPVTMSAREAMPEQSGVQTR